MTVESPLLLLFLDFAAAVVVVVGFARINDRQRSTSSVFRKVPGFPRGSSRARLPSIASRQHVAGAGAWVKRAGVQGDLGPLQASQ